MSNLLIEIKEEVNSTKAHNDHLDSSKISAFEARYDKIVEDGLKANLPPPPEKQPEKKGKLKQTPPKNLLDRLQSHKKSVLLFMHDFRVPFDNNQGERDVRMIKVSKKYPEPSAVMMEPMRFVVFVDISLQYEKMVVMSLMPSRVLLKVLLLFRFSPLNDYA